MTQVVNKRYEQYDVYIGRGSKWGNPYIIGVDGNRAEVIAGYRIWLWQQIREGKITLADLRSLDGKRLGCYCSPLPCHGDVLVGAIEWSKEVV